MSEAPVPPRYVFKTDPYSSHSVMLRWLGPGHGRRLLDVGAADGLLDRYLTTAGWRVTAIEADPGLAEIGRSHCEHMVVADLNQGVPELGAPFDAIVCGDVLEHLADPLAVLQRLVGSLASQGRVVISVPNVAHVAIRLSLLAGRFEYQEAGILDRTHLRFFTRRACRELIAAAGLVPVRCTVTPAPLHRIVPARWHGRVLGAVHAASAALSRAFPRLLGYQFVVLAGPGGRS